jgi:hypothetical protein
VDDEEELARALAEFGIHLPPVEDDGADDAGLPRWDDDDMEGWG